MRRHTCVVGMMLGGLWLGCHGAERAPVVHPGQQLGELDFQAYCDATRAGRALTRRGWVCERGTIRVPIDPDAACALQFPRTHPHGEPLRASDTVTYVCYAGIVGELGGLDVDAYCRSTGARRAGLTADQRWNCQGTDNQTSPVDMDVACRTRYPQADGAHARQLRPDNPMSWVCVRP